MAIPEPVTCLHTHLYMYTHTPHTHCANIVIDKGSRDVPNLHSFKVQSSQFSSRHTDSDNRARAHEHNRLNLCVDCCSLKTTMADYACTDTRTNAHQLALGRMKSISWPLTHTQPHTRTNILCVLLTNKSTWGRTVSINPERLLTVCLLIVGVAMLNWPKRTGPRGAWTLLGLVKRARGKKLESF